MHPSKGDYSGRRTAPLSVTPAIVIDKSDVGRDLLVRINLISLPIQKIKHLQQ